MRYFIYIIFLTTAVQAFAQQADTLKARVQAVRNGAEAMQQKSGAFQSTLDSTRQRVVPDTLTRALVSVRQKTDSIQQGIASLPQRLTDSLEIVQKTTARIEKIETKANEKLTLFNQQGAELPALPDTPSLPAAALPDAPAVPSLPAAKLPEATLPTTDLSLPEVGKVVPEEITEAGAMAGQAKTAATEIKAGNTEQLEQGVLKANGVDGVSDQLAQADKMQRYYDPEVAKEELLNKTKSEAVNHFAGHEAELKAVMEKLSAKKAKMPDTQGLVDLFAKRQSPFKGKPVVERMMPGLTLQVQRTQSYWFDFNPYINFRITPRFTAALGWNERVCYDFKNNRWDTQNRIRGVRSSVLFHWKQNTAFVAEAEVMNAPVRASYLITSDIIKRDWVWSYFAGIRRSFAFSKTLKGNVQMLYNLYNPHKQSPYTNRLNVRIGLERTIIQKPKP